MLFYEKFESNAILDKKFITVPLLIFFVTDWGRQVVVVWLLDLQLHVQSVPIIIYFVSSNTAHGDVYSIQHYVIKFYSDFRQVGGFLRFPPSIKLTTTI